MEVGWKDVLIVSSGDEHAQSVTKELFRFSGGRDVCFRKFFIEKHDSSFVDGLATALGQAHFDGMV